MNYCIREYIMPLRGDSMDKLIVKGDIIYTPDKDYFEIHEDSYVLIERGKVVAIVKDLEEKYKDYKFQDYTGKLIIPGFVDLHLHAPQFPNKGLGMDKELLPWLETYTFPEEAKYKDLDYADRVYRQFIKALWEVGTTRAVVFSSVHIEATKHLIDLYIESGLGAYVGKVNMDRNTSDDLVEDTERSMVETEEIIIEYKEKSSLVKPIITPRFVPTCSEELMRGLGNLAINYGIPVQSHLSENISEVAWVKELHPESNNYASVYNEFNLFGQTNTIMAHCIHTTEEEIQLMANNSVFAAHCPFSNFNLSSGIMPVRKYLDMKVPVGLGSDIAGGNYIDIRKVMTGAIQASKIKWMESQGKFKALSSSEAFFLGTKGGGSFFGKVGSFEEGYEFDSLIIDDSDYHIKDLSVEERLQRYIYGERQGKILARYVRGREIHRPK